MNPGTIEAIEQNIRQAKNIVDFGTAVERLRINKDFKKVVMEGYFEQEAIRLVHLKADPSMQSQESQKSIINQMDAIGTLAQYFNVALQRAALAGKSIEADEEARDELLNEDLNND